MRVAGIILIIIAYIQGVNALFYFGILPVIARMWTWSDFGLPLVVGLVASTVFFNLGDWLKNKASKRARQTSDNEEVVV